jgi:HNH endonuclease
VINPYKGYKVFGPYLDKRYGRKVVILESKTTKRRTSTSYARYLMSMKLGRLLKSNEEVEHKDDVRLNDSIDNLRIVQRHRSSARNRPKHWVTLICPNCKIEFKREFYQTNEAKGGKYPTSCTRSCAVGYRHKMDKIKGV